MNRRRQESSTPVSVFLSLFLAAAIVTAGGVLHAYYKNRQIQVSREIDAIDRRVEQYRLDIRTTEMRMDQLLNRFAILKQVQDNGTLLRPMYPKAVVEEVGSSAASRPSVVSTLP
jgi:cell division protein FtsL